jgi:fatty-acyl-CoA synthase
VTPGYYRDPESNARAFDAEGSFLTGDLGMLDAAGRLHFRGRLRDLIKSGGINISPLEVAQRGRFFTTCDRHAGKTALHGTYWGSP